MLLFAILESLHPAPSRYPTHSYEYSVPKARDPSNTGRDQGIVDASMQMLPFRTSYRSECLTLHFAAWQTL